MSEINKNRTLSLVVNNDNEEAAISQKPKRSVPQKQLNLPLDEENLFALIPAAMLDSSTLSNFIRQHKPRWVYDLRKSPRLDVIAGNRQSAFDMFQSFDANYVALKNLAQTSSQCVHEDTFWWADSFNRHLNTVGTIKGPYILIFDSQSDFEMVKLTLTTMVEKMLPRNEHLDFLEYN